MHEEGSDRCRSNESYGHSLTELAVPACKSGEYNPPPSVPHMDGKRAAPLAGRRVVFFGGGCTCRAGPMCPAAGYAFFGGARGPRPTGQVRYPPVGDGVPQWSAAEQMPLGYDVPSARQRRAGRRIPTPVCTPRALASRRALARNDSASRCLGGQSRPPLRCEARGVCMRDIEGGVSDGITRRPAGMRLRVAPIRLTTFRDAGMIAVVPSHS